MHKLVEKWKIRHDNVPPFKSECQAFKSLTSRAETMTDRPRRRVALSCSRKQRSVREAARLFTAQRRSTLSL